MWKAYASTGSQANGNPFEESSRTVLNMEAMMAKEDAVSIIQLDDDESCYDPQKYDSHRASIMIINEKSR